MAFTVGNSMEKRLENASSVCALGKTIEKRAGKTSLTLAFSWSRSTIDKHHIFMVFTVGNSVGKRSENAALAR